MRDHNEFDNGLILFLFVCRKQSSEHNFIRFKFYSFNGFHEIGLRISNAGKYYVSWM